MYVWNENWVEYNLGKKIYQNNDKYIVNNTLNNIVKSVKSSIYTTYAQRVGIERLTTKIRECYNAAIDEITSLNNKIDELNHINKPKNIKKIPKKSK